MFSNPQQILEQFRLEPGTHVADLGSGSGFFTLAAARMVGPSGRVYAVDAMKEMLTKVKNEASRARLLNVEALWGNIEKLGGTRLADGTVEVVMVCSTLFQLESKTEFPLEVKRILKAKGRVLVIDWRGSFNGLGPQEQHVVSPDVARTFFEKAGFTFEREISVGTHHYGFVFKRGA